MPSILVFYSSPGNEERLRLDKEHKRMQDAINLSGDSSFTVDRHHAATLDDMARALSVDTFDLLHFSGHGSSDGFCFESQGDDDGEIISPEQLNRIIKASQSTISALVLMSCYSSDTAKELLACSPYVVAVSGAADDEATIDFVGHFYERYFRTKSIEHAFEFSNAFVGDRLTTVLWHRSTGQDSATAQARVVVYPYGGDRIYIDYAEARSSIERLGVPIEKFLSILSRKIRVHRWIFEGERDSVILPIGGYFASFSWRNAKDVVRCKWVKRPKAGLDSEVLDLVARLIVVYNDLYMSGYRRSGKRAQDQDIRVIQSAISNMHGVHTSVLANTANFEMLASVLPDQIKMTRANYWANLQKADEKLAQRDLAAAAVYAETALSTLHDAVEDLVEAISD
jgi:hypothetical protein